MKEIINVTMNISMAHCLWPNVQVEGTCAYLEHNESAVHLNVPCCSRSYLTPALEFTTVLYTYSYIGVYNCTLHLHIHWSLQKRKKYICTYLGVHEDKVHLRKGEEEV